MPWWMILLSIISAGLAGYSSGRAAPVDCPRCAELQRDIDDLEILLRRARENSKEGHLPWQH